MSPSSLEAATPSRFLAAARLPVWLAGALLALLFGVLLAPSTAQAGTITIVDGPDTPPVNGVYTDGYIQNYLAITGSLSISTTGVVTGPDQIRVLQDAVITWTTGNTLTLDAGSRVIISGTIQQNGPANGAGGLYLLASEAPTGAVIVGPGDQTAGTAAGSRFGVTRVRAGNLVLLGGGDPEAYAQLGYHAVDKGAAYTITGPISVTVSHNITATADADTYAYVQIGHGGADTLATPTLSGAFSGPIAVDAGGNVTFVGGADSYTYAMLGNGGTYAGGNHSGDHRLNAGGDVLFQGGSDQANAQFGNGGFAADGDQSGSHSLSAGGDVTFQGGDAPSAYVQFGNGGYSAKGDHTSQLRLTAEEDVAFLGGSGPITYAQFGNGGYLADGDGSNSHSLVANGDVTFQGGSGNATYAQFGNGGGGAVGNHSGGHTLLAGGDIVFEGGSDTGSYAQLGNGGDAAIGNHSGDHQLAAGGDVTFEGGSDSYTSAQLGNGGMDADGDHSDNLTLFITGNLTVTAGSGTDAYAMIGHGSDVRSSLVFQSAGNRAGDITLRVGETAVFSGSQVGHLTANGVLSVTQGSTLIGVSQNNPYANGTGQLLVTGVTTTSFTSAPDAVGGELRIYLPRDESQQIPTNATFNGESFVTANTIPSAQLAGFALFGDGPYIPDYSFYLGGQPDLAVTKTATPAGPLQPGDTLTYTVSFSNTGNITATDVVINDSLPGVLTGAVAALLPDPGVVISETSPAPNLAWSVSTLAPGKGGRIRIATTLQNTALGATLALSPSPTLSLAPALTTTVDVRNNFFTPDPITITVGSAVRWERIEGFHNVVADDSSFTNGAASSSWTAFEHTFNTAGTFPYHCEVHGGAGGIGMSGTVIVEAEPTPSSSFTNTATITATGDITLTNNTASVTSSFIPAASLTITKTVVGDPPANAWQFIGSGAIGSFSLPAIGGSKVITNVIATTYTISETVQSGYTAAVACSTGDSGTNSVQVKLEPGAAVGCTFTNTATGPRVRVRLPAIHVGPQ